MALKASRVDGAIECITSVLTPEKDNVEGYDGPGWYFWQSSAPSPHLVIHGPFSTVELTKDCRDKYFSLRATE